MEKDNTLNNLNNYDNEIDFFQIINILWIRRWFIVSLTSAFSIFAVFFSLSLPNIYESKAVLSPSNPSTSISKSLQGYSGLAGLAGINLTNAVDKSNSAKAILKLKSLSFFQNQILPNIFLPDLMALESWDFKTNKLIYDQAIYDTNSNAWVREYSYPSKQIPSAQESFQKFQNVIFEVIEEKDSGFVTLSIKHQSPFIAKKWAELMVDEVNTFYRHKDKTESEKAIKYLNKQIVKTNISEVKEAISQLLQEETKKLALIEANQFYVFDYIDPPVVMEKKSEPKRAIICILIAFLGGMISVFYVLIKHYFLKEKQP